LQKFMLDSGSQINLLTLETARAFFREQRVSNLRVLGVSGASKAADLAGHLVILVQAPDGTEHHLDLGVAHGMSGCPMNLLSVSLLIKMGAVLHFEEGNCFFRANSSAEPIPLHQKDGMFELFATRGDLVPEVSSSGGRSYMVHGKCFATSADLRLWHRRVRHMDAAFLKQIHDRKVVDGFKLSGRNFANCSCDTCQQAKIRRRAAKHEREFPSPATRIGHTVSTDVKTLPFASFQGYRYCVNFVDHYSGLGLCYFMRHKNEVTAKLKTYISEMARFGIKVAIIQSDRGSEYFAQEGDTLMHRDRRQHEFDALCAAQSPPILHKLTPVESHEKVAEVWFRDHFRAANAMLWEARLSPAFWADAVAYSQYLFNRIPNAKLPDGASPWTALTGERTRWDKFRVFGADVFEHIPNNEYADVPGIPRGRKLIFVGFSPNLNGFRVFDHEARRYFSTANVYINEDFGSRIDALRHHDQRRALLKIKAEQPVVMDDFADTQNSSAVRNLYLDPDAPCPEDTSHEASSSPGVINQRGGARAVDMGGATGQPELLLGSRRGAAAPRQPQVSDSRLPVDLPTFANKPANPGPLSPQAVAAERAKRIAQHDVMLRPLRLLAIGKEQLYTPEDKAFLDYVKARNVPLVFQAPCPKNERTPSGRRYIKYMHAKTFREAIEMGATIEDFRWDYRRGWIRFPKHEPHITGHVFNALEVAAEHGHTHALEDAGLLIRDSAHNVTLLAHAFNVRGQRDSFNRILETVFEPEVTLQQLEDRELSLRWAEHQMSKVFNSASINIDFSLAPEPTRFQETQPEVCAEHERWREAMDDEMAAMVKFGVYRRVPKSAAGTRQILGCRWVYKRKVDKLGQVSRYRARLVAQGFAQRAYDSY
jgi:hypothetical protein